MYKHRRNILLHTCFGETNEDADQRGGQLEV